MTVTFEGEEGEEYNLSVVDVLKITPEMLEALNITEEEYNAIKETIIKSTKEYGDLLNVFVIEVDHRGQQYKGEVNFKVKMTDEMKKYNKFRFIYVDENNNFKVGEVVDVKIDGEYITGTLPHLSVYALVGSYEENSNNPKTSDNVIINLIMLVVSLSGLAGGIVYYKKRLAKNN